MLICVDQNDRPLTEASKFEVHSGKGQRHRAFSIFIFSEQNELLLQQRASDKRLWPGFWTNSCCSHPRAGENLTDAAHRRLNQELGIQCPLHYLYRFEYRAEFETLGTEHEVCSVFIGKVDRNEVVVQAHPEEISAWKWQNLDEVAFLRQNQTEQLTPWFILEWDRLRAQFWENICALPPRD
jgi:isopentenyl-diphosphate delta-isomerase